MTPPLTPSQAWQPLSFLHWNEAAARHLLRRVGWAATPTEVQRAHRSGLRATLDRLFPSTIPAFPRTAAIEREITRTNELRQLRRATEDYEERQKIDREQRELNRVALEDLALRWLRAAAQPDRAALEKWIFFLSNLYVVSAERVRVGQLIHLHHDLLRQGALGTAPDLAKAVSRSPAMVIYLDLQGSQSNRPNENFARELFELFTLGEGHYTEDDIKEAARAFTGYRQYDGQFRFRPAQHDSGRKTLFGQSGNFRGDDVIDLIFQQPAAGTFVPREMTRFYLTDSPLPPELFAALGTWWKGRNYNFRELCLRFFSSTLFYHPSFRAGHIKSPVHYYLGLLNDLQIDSTPLPRTTLNPLRLMGQNLFFPPNVRGWVGGRLWINSSTLAARRQLVDALFTPVNEARLNADDQIALRTAREEGATAFTVDQARLTAFAALGAEAIADRFVTYFLPVPVNPAYRDTLLTFLKGDTGIVTPARVRQAAISVLQAPEYQLS